MSSWTSTQVLQRPTQTDASEDQHWHQNLGNHRPGPSLWRRTIHEGSDHFKRVRRDWRETTTSKSQSRLTTCTGNYLLWSMSPSFLGSYRSHQPQTIFPLFVNQGVIWSLETRSCQRRRRRRRVFGNRKIISSYLNKKLPQAMDNWLVTAEEICNIINIYLSTSPTYCCHCTLGNIWTKQ